MEIAGHKTINDWNILLKKIKPNYNQNWDEAYKFFELRICTRYLKPIEAVLNLNTNNGEGFAVVNLQCSLIETIESFINGWEFKVEPYGWYNINGQKLKIKNLLIFESFFKKRKPFVEYEVRIDGEKFYQNVRCGLLHETQTKNNWKIKYDTDKSSLAYQEINNGNIVEKIIYRENFQRDLEKLITLYRNSIVTGAEFDGISACELRENFIAKFNHICTESMPKQL